MDKRSHLGFSALAAVSLAASTALPLWLAQSKTQESAVSPRAQKDFIVDATSTRVPVRRYERIVSCSPIADDLIFDLVASERVIGVSARILVGADNRFRGEQKVHVDGVTDIESLLSLSPDLVLVSSYGGETSAIERLRELGITVFDLGPMRGSQTLVKNMRDVGALVGEANRGEQLASSFVVEMAHVAADIPIERRRTALFLDIYDTQLWGGTCGSSYHDVLTAAGLIDAAPCDPNSTQSWPRFSAEDVIAMHPSVIVTSAGKAVSLRAMPPLAMTVLTDAQIVELDDNMLRDPGPAMLRAAEALRTKVYPEKDTTR